MKNLRSKMTNSQIHYLSALKIDNFIAKLGHKNSKIIFVSDKKIWRNSKRFFDKNFLKNNQENLILTGPKANNDNVEGITAIAKDYDLILALGSGTINDLCKISAAKLKIPYIIIPSAASMNGYLSQNASITVLGHKKTLAATLPLAVFCDLKILQAAPLYLTKAGIGDSLCFYSCWFDCYLSHKILGTKFIAQTFDMLKTDLDFLINNFDKFKISDQKFLKLLIKILLLSGQAMTIAGNSSPASQLEHLISHVIEMKYGHKINNLHGAQIAVTTLTAADLQQELLNLKNPPQLIADEKFPQKELENFFNKEIAKECEKEFKQKIFSSSKIRKINDNINKNWPQIKLELQKIYFSKKNIKAILRHFKVRSTPESLALTKTQYQESISYARFIRNRFTSLDLLTGQ